MNGADLNVKDVHGWCPLMLGMSHRNFSGFLIDQQFNLSLTFFFIAFLAVWNGMVLIYYFISA